MSEEDELSSAFTRKETVVCLLCAFQKLQGQGRIRPKKGAQNELTELICIGNEIPCAKQQISFCLS